MHDNFKSYYEVPASERPGLVKALSSRAFQKLAIFTSISTYLKYMGLAWIVVGVAFTVQVIFFYRRFEASFLFMPMAVATLIGVLLGRVSLLKDRLRHKTGLFRTVADLAQEFIYFRRIDGSYEYASPSCLELTGYTAEEFRSSPGLFDRIIHPDDQESWRKHLHNVCGTGLHESLDIRLRAKSGKTVWISHVCSPVFNSEGRQIGTRSTNLDISQRKDFEERAERLAYYDPLTNLPNRRSLTRTIKNLIESAMSTDGNFSVLFLDLDRFKHINDTFGHAFGDRLLRKVAGRLRHCCRHGSIIARFGGDEFVIVAPHLSKAAVEVEGYARKVLENIERPFELDGLDLYLSGRVGVAVFPYDGENAGTLIRNADLAMYKSKKDPHRKIRFYSSEMANDTAAFVSTENSMRKALEQDDFLLYYQPIVDISSGEILALEALVRWHRSGEGIVLPERFIPVAEETGLINPMGEQLLRKLCSQLQKWQQNGTALPVALNVSGIQLVDARFFLTIDEIVSKGEFDPSLITLEVTEQILLNEMDLAVDRLRSLRQRGLSIALDDFGTGYSSLNYLKELPINILKIDGGFIRNIPGNSRDLAILRAILSFCGELNLKAVVEGIESEDQREVLCSLGFHVGQGFLFHRPMPVEEIDRLLAESSGHSNLSDA